MIDDPDDMAFVINLEDGVGKEFYIDIAGNPVPLEEEGQKPLILKTHKQVEKQLKTLKTQFASNCQLYAVEQNEFEERQKQLRKKQNR
jgi:hypothetical protein